MTLNLFFFFLLLIMSTLFSISSTNWMGAWMGLEMNLMTFIPILSSEKNMLSNESTLKYFLTQSLASTFFLFSSISNSLFVSFHSNFFYSTLTLMIITASLMLKLGSAPFHSWFISMLEGLSWLKIFILSTIQKISPLFIMNYSKPNLNILFLFILSCSLIGSIGGLNQTSLRKIMGYSSINHLAWILTSMIYSKFIMLIYFLSYCFMTMIIMILFQKMKLFFSFQLFNNVKSKIMMYTILINMLSLGGLPPFFGFLPKWMILINLMEKNMFICTILVFTTLITLFYYIQLIMPIMLIYNNNNKLSMNNIKLNFYMIMMISMMSSFSSIGLIMFPLLI
uniref:NADH-ubiquinone oxidoreductase chain 2 n=1 Tax=Stimulopalpus japonicus TaxID=209965 RepID=A0A343QCI7_9NEOP|nr:NADH dehydrogenase subunit 2 [Stimulopalpus japonicus]ATU07134.1 NADH dehydrogenase subunit 2 [Stimulopalpus japonicus]